MLLVEECKDFLHSTECERGNKYGAAIGKCLADIEDEALDFGSAGGVFRAGVSTTSSFRNEDINGLLGKAGGGDDFLVGKEAVSRNKDALALIDQAYACSAGNVACLVEADFDGFSLSLHAASMAILHGDYLTFEAVYFGMGVEGQLGHAEIVPLAAHNVDGVMEHALVELLRGEAHEQPCVWGRAHGDGDGAEVVEVAVGEKNEVDILVADAMKIGEASIACFLGIEACVYKDVKGADFEEGTVGADAACGVEVSIMHGKGVGGIYEKRWVIIYGKLGVEAEVVGLAGGGNL